MERRSLLQALPAAGLLLTVPCAARAKSAQAGGWRTFETVTRLEITPPNGAVQAWVPLPLSEDTDWFQTLENGISGNLETSRIVLEPVYRAAMVEVPSKLGTPDSRVEVKPGAGMQATAAEFATYLKSTELMPSDGIVRETALEIRKRARTNVDKAPRPLPVGGREHLAQPGAAASATSRRCCTPGL